LTEITYNGANVLIMCVVGVWRHIYAAKHRPHSSTDYHSLMMDPI